MPNRPKSAALGRHQSALFGILAARGLLKHDALASALEAATGETYQRTTVTHYVSGERRPEFGVLGVLAHHVGAHEFLKACAEWLAPGVFDVVERGEVVPTGRDLRTVGGAS